LQFHVSLDGTQVQELGSHLPQFVSLLYFLIKSELNIMDNLIEIIREAVLNVDKLLPLPSKEKIIVLPPKKTKKVSGDFIYKFQPKKPMGRPKKLVNYTQEQIEADTKKFEIIQAEWRRVFRPKNENITLEHAIELYNELLQLHALDAINYSLFWSLKYKIHRIIKVITKREEEYERSK
jgi:hypothetical protein